MNCTYHKKIEQGDSLWNDWLDLMLRVSPEIRIFTPQWYSTWNETLGSTGRWSGRLSVVAVRDDQGVLQGVLPLARQKFGPFSVLSSAGDWQPWRTIVAAQDQEADVGLALGDFIAKQSWPLLRLGPYPVSSMTNGGMAGSLRRHDRFMKLRTSAPLAICRPPATFEQYKTRELGGKFFRKIGYYERRFKKQGEVEMIHYRQPSDEETDRMIDQLAEIEERSWLVAAENGHPRFAHKASKKFWTSVIKQSLSPRDQVDCWVQTLDERPVSFVFTLTSGRSRYVLANQYIEEVKDHRTGSTLYRYMMEDGIERGIQLFDFGDSEIHYKRLWGASYQDSLDSYVVVPNAILSKLAHGYTALKAKLSDIFTRPDISKPKPRIDLESLPADSQIVKDLGSAKPNEIGEMMAIVESELPVEATEALSKQLTTIQDLVDAELEADEGAADLARIEQLAQQVANHMDKRNHFEEPEEDEAAPAKETPTPRSDKAEQTTQG